MIQRRVHKKTIHVRRETRDFFTTFNKTLSSMYAFFYSNNLKVTYIRAYMYYLYAIRKCHIPHNAY